MQLPSLRKMCVTRAALQYCIMAVAVSDPFVSVNQLSIGSEYSTEEVEVSNPMA